MDYEKDLTIDSDALDIMCLDQPSLFMRYAKIHAEAKRNLEEVKQNLDIVKADIDKQIREKPEKFKIEKVTEGAIQSAILTEGTYNIAYKKFLDAKYESDMAQNAVNAITQKKEMIEALIKLFGQSYFAGPRTPRDLSKENELRHKKVDSGVASHLTRSRR